MRDASRAPGRKRRLLVLVGFLLLGLGSRCESGDVETLGFLGDYSGLRPGGVGQANLIYIDGDADFSLYSTIVVEPIVAWAGSQPEAGVETKELAGKLEADLRRELAHEFEVVDDARADSMRLRAALAGDRSDVILLEIELLEAHSGRRLVAAVDQRRIPVGERARQPAMWAVLIRDRLAAFRRFDAAHRARESTPEGS